MFKTPHFVFLTALLLGCGGEPLKDGANTTEDATTLDDATFAGTNEDGATETGDAEPTADTEKGDTDEPELDTQAQDASETEESDDVASVDATTEPEPLPPTWWDCRRSLVSGEITDELKAECDARFLEPPTERVYGIRWVFLTEVEDRVAWIDARIPRINEIYANAQMSFITTSMATLDEPIIQVAESDEEFTLEALVPDIQQYLEIDESDPDAVVEALKARQLEAGVDADAVAQTTLTKTMKPQSFLQTMARLRPEEIHVMVLKSINGAGAAGMSTGPGPSPISPRVSVVNIRSEDKFAEVALPHEFGHFFGLKHPHGKKESEQALAVNFDFDDAVSKTPSPEDMLVTLADFLGEDLSGAPGEIYVPYNTQGAATQASTRRRYAIANLWLARGYTSRNGNEGPEAFPSLANFVAWGSEGKKILRKNFVWGADIEAPGNNCGWDDDAEMLSCSLGDPPTVYTGDDPMLLQTITVDGGVGANIMTYIPKAVPADQENFKVGFTDEQIRVLHIHANTPVRQTLRNHVE